MCAGGSLRFDPYSKAVEAICVSDAQASECTHGFPPQQNRLLLHMIRGMPSGNTRTMLQRILRIVRYSSAFLLRLLLQCGKRSGRAGDASI
jgi:hypothetical protein